MPEITTAVALIAAGSLLLGAILGWFLYSLRSEQKRKALNAEWNEQLSALQRSEKRVNKERKDLAAELAAVRTKLNTLAGADSTDTLLPVQDEGSAEKLETALQESYRRRDELREQLDRLIARSRDMAAAMHEKDEKIFALSRELESWQQRLPPLVDKFREKDLQNTVILEQLEAERALSAELSNTMRTRIMPSSFAANESASNGAASHAVDAESTTEGDDLKRIRGVGPVLERTLNRLGIYRFEQIAEFDQDDIERIAAELGQFPDRINRDRWVEQARNLL